MRDSILLGLTKGAVRFEAMSYRTNLFSRKFPYVRNTTSVEKVNQYFAGLDRVKSIPMFARSPEIRTDSAMPRYFYVRPLRRMARTCTTAWERC